MNRGTSLNFYCGGANRAGVRNYSVTPLVSALLFK